MPTPPNIVVARKPRRSREAPPKPAPTCGIIVRHVRGRRAPELIDPEAEAMRRGWRLRRGP